MKVKSEPLIALMGCDAVVGRWWFGWQGRFETCPYRCGMKVKWIEMEEFAWMDRMDRMGWWWFGWQGRFETCPYGLVGCRGLGDAVVGRWCLVGRAGLKPAPTGWLDGEGWVLRWWEGGVWLAGQV